MLRIIKLIIEAMLVAYLVIFSVSNVGMVTFKPLMNIVQYEIPLFLLVIIVLFIGVIIGAVVMFLEKQSVSFQLRRVQKELQAEKKEVERLQKITISEEQKVESVEKKEEEQAPVTADNDIKNALR